MKFLPVINVPPGLRARIKEQIAVGDIIKHHWLNFGSYENWRQVKAGNLQPRIQGVMDFLAPYGSQNEDISSPKEKEPFVQPMRRRWMQFLIQGCISRVNRK